MGGLEETQGSNAGRGACPHITLLLPAKCYLIFCVSIPFSQPCPAPPQRQKGRYEPRDSHYSVARGGAGLLNGSWTAASGGHGGQSLAMAVGGSVHLDRVGDGI